MAEATMRYYREMEKALKLATTYQDILVNNIPVCYLDHVPTVLESARLHLSHLGIVEAYLNKAKEEVTGRILMLQVAEEL